MWYECSPMQLVREMRIKNGNSTMQEHSHDMLQRAMENTARISRRLRRFMGLAGHSGRSKSLDILDELCMLAMEICDLE